MALIEIKNDQNMVLIGDSYYHHRIIQKGTLVGKAQVYPLAPVDCMMTANRPVDLNAQSMPIVAMTPKDHNGPIGLFAISNTTSGNGSINFHYCSNMASNNKLFDYYMFQDGLSVPMAGTGLVVLRNEQGIVTFDSDAGYASLVDVVTVPMNVPIYKTYKAGRKYAVSVACPIVLREPGQIGGQYGNAWQMGAYINGNSITFSGFWVRKTTTSESQGSPNGNAQYGTFMVFDVTGLDNVNIIS